MEQDKLFKQASEFFEKFSVYIEKQHENVVPIDEKDVETFFGDFGEKWAEELSKGESFNVWDLAALGSDELKNSAILAWFLDTRASHGQGGLFLKSLSSLLKDKIAEECFNAASSVKVESLPMGDQESRVDVEIVGEEFLLFIEVKIEAGLQDKQLERYLEIAKEKSESKNVPYAVCFLTKTGMPPATIEDKYKKEIVSLSWQQCVGGFVNAVQDECNKDKLFIRLITQQFYDHVCKF